MRLLCPLRSENSVRTRTLECFSVHFNHQNDALHIVKQLVLKIKSICGYLIPFGCLSASIAALSHFVQQHPTLRSVTFRTRSVPDGCAVLLADMLRNPRLEEVTWLTMEIAPLGARAWAEAIARNSTLSKLYIGVSRDLRLSVSPWQTYALSHAFFFARAR